MTPALTFSKVSALVCSPYKVSTAENAFENARLRPCGGVHPSRNSKTSVAAYMYTITRHYREYFLKNMCLEFHDTAVQVEMRWVVV